MSTETVQQQAAELLAAWAKETNAPEPDRLYVTIDATDLVAAVTALEKARWGYLAAITGEDHGVEAGQIEVMYHFCSGATVLTLRMFVPRDNPSVPSLFSIIPSVTFHERELSEMLGVTVVGTPNTERLFLPDDWPEGVYPLRKDFNRDQLTLPPAEHPPSIKRPASKEREKFIVPIGPQHPALKEPGHFEFSVDGETVTDASVRLGYVHRGIEKGTEDRNWVQSQYLVEHICGICSHVHATAFCLGVEHLAGVEAPPRAQAIRELVAELERIHSHMLWLGVAAHEAGFDTLFMYSWRDRETVMNLLERVTGNRVNYSANVLGGVKCDIDGQQADAIFTGLDFLEGRIHHYLEVVTQDMMFLRRTRGIAPITAEQAERLGVVGPTARASGVMRDVRVEAPYAAYAQFPVTLVTETAGDLEARFVVRIRELFESIRVIRELLNHMPEGELTARMPRRVKVGETISRVEAPRGELFYYIRSNGSDTAERVKVRTPTLPNMASVLTLSIGAQLADVPMILAGIDPCFSCNDRMISIRDNRGGSRLWTWEDLRQYGINYYR